jgi:hypothetical protein
MQAAAAAHRLLFRMQNAWLGRTCHYRDVARLEWLEGCLTTNIASFDESWSQVAPMITVC